MARKYSRDNRGRFASSGSGATARGGRLRTAAGNKRKTQTMKAAGAGGAGVMKGAVKRDPGAAGKVGKAAPKARFKRTGQKIAGPGIQKNTIAKSALQPDRNEFGYGKTRKENVRAAIRQAQAAGVGVKINRSRKAKNLATYSEADKKITIYAGNDAWKDIGGRFTQARRTGWAASSRKGALMAHEIGHAKSSTLTSGATWTSVATKAGHKIDPKAIDNLKPIRRISGRVSAYAREHPQEFVAEYRSARAGGRRFDPEVNRLYRAAAGVSQPATRRRNALRKPK